jgi:peptide/nickel transport system ATP-binding protein
MRPILTQIKKTEKREMRRKIIQIENLSTWFKTQRGYLKAVDNISFEVYEGETLCIVGESGSGKSVTARSILRILPSNGHIQEGRIFYFRYNENNKEPELFLDIAKVKKNGREINQLRINEISMIFQEPMSALSPIHRCGDQISEAILLKWPGTSKKEAHERTVELLKKVMIHNPEEVAMQYPFELSGGMRQRICIALAISCDPKVLIADEPTTALDVTTQREILRLIAKLQRDMGMTVIFITHDMGVVSQIADRIVVMQKGKIVEENNPIPIFHEPLHDYTKRLIKSTLVLESRCPEKKDARDIIHEKFQPLLRVSNLTKVFESKSGGLFRKNKYSVTAVDNVSFEVYPGETVGIAGESGSGKTTLGRCLVGYYPVTDGEVI